MKKFLTLLILLTALVLGAKRFWTEPNQVAITVLSCADITKGCGDSFFSARFAEVPQVMKPLHVLVHFNRPEAIQKVHIDFAMKDMGMGLNRYRLIPSNHSSDWQAEITLPVCAQGRSDWNMLIEFETEDDLQRIQIPFSAKANRKN